MEEFLKQYSIDDLARSFFVIDLWLPNISAQIKIQYLYTILESIHDRLPEENKINNYEDFENFCQKLFEIIPPFPTLEDYVPESDWGDIKYYFEKKFFSIFYGGDLSNPYDFYYSFEIIHRTFKDDYESITGRSPLNELHFCLKIQDYILNNLDQEKSKKLNDISPGDISLPSETFWNNCRSFMDSFNPNNVFDQNIIDLYTKKLDKPSEFVKINAFLDKAFKGENCEYFFIKVGQEYYPTIPRRYLAILYDKWGKLYRRNLQKITERIDGKKLEVLLGIQLYNFLSMRIKEENIFPLASPVDGKLYPHELTFTAVHAENKLFLIYTTPPVYDFDELQKYVDNLEDKLKEAYNLVKKIPTRLGLGSEKRIVEFRSSIKKNSGLDPVFLIVLPPGLTSVMGGIKPPKGIPSEVIGLDQVAGIFDEIENPKEVADFFDYIVAERNLSRIVPLNSYLDRFGSFKDSGGVLVPGANEPNMIMLDFNWGSNFRFRNLKDFWEAFPSENLYGHPRGWDIPADYVTNTGCILSSKTFFGYAYHQTIGNATFFINGPVHLIDLEIGKTLDPLMQSLFDAIDKYSEKLNQLDIAKDHKKIQVFFCPSSLAENHEAMKHIKHLVQKEKVWAMDIGRLKIDTYGVRVVYNDDLLIKALNNAKDRSVQINLLTDVLEKIGELTGDTQTERIIKKLEKEKSKKPRFKMFQERKKASFPEGVGVVYPDTTQFKLADKVIAVNAKTLNIKPGDYSGDLAKRNLNLLRDSIVSVINKKVEEYSFSKSFPYIIEKIDALIHDMERKEAEIKASADQEVDYVRGEKYSEDHNKFLHWHKTLRYLLEKFVCLQPKGDETLGKNELKELLALTDRLHDVYTASDIIHYDLLPAHISIDRDYLVSIAYDVDMSKMEKEYGEEQSRLNLGEIGNKDDTADSTIPIEKYLDDLDVVFKEDLGFGLKNFINVQQVLSLWADYSEKEDAKYYSATTGEISDLCSKIIDGYDASETEAILDFLTLKPENLLVIKGDFDDQGNQKIAEDLPVWEYNKRLDRYSIKPIVKIGDKYYWGPHSIERTGKIWSGIPTKHRLPADFDTPNVNKVLNKGHEDLRSNLVQKIKEIVLRYTKHVDEGVYPHNITKGIDDIGDVDVLAYLEEKNVLLNIESKIISPPYCHKDSGRMQRNVFIQREKENGSIEKSYVKRVEERAEFLRTHSKKVLDKIGVKTSKKDPQVISLFVTKMGFWWMKHPPIDTDVNFVEIRLLDDFMRDL